MRPASKPKASCSLPRVGLMSSWVCRANDIGNAPNFSCWANARADSMVKLPVIEA